MAARGARSRKVLDKTIEKKERKQEAKAIASSFNRGDSPSRWEISSSNSRSEGSAFSTNKSNTTGRLQYGSNTRNTSRPSSASGMSALSSDSKKDKAKYQAKGKETSHPRGRGGGVPTKAAAPSRLDRPLTRSSSSRATNNPHDSNPKARKWAGVMLWHGNGHRPQPYRGFEHDSDLFLETGDCYIYFTEETDELNPRPAMRLHVSELEKAKSTLLSNLVRYGVIEKEVDEYDMFPRTPTSTGPPSRLQLPTGTNGAGYSEDMRLPRWESSERPLRPIRRANTTDSSRSPAALGRLQTIDEPTHISASDIGSSGSYSNDEVEITHEVWFPAPAYMRSQQAMLRHHIAQRNFFALIYNKAIVGADFMEMLNELQTVIDTFYELDSKAQTQWSAQMIARYLLFRKLDDVRGNVRMALGLLGWCEQDNVRWMAGYLEAFVHCAGMMTPSVIDSTEFKRLSTVTRMNLNNAANMLQLRVIEAEEKLASFDLSDIWPTPPTKASAGNAYQKSFAAFQEFLINYYHRKCGGWPPPRSSTRGRWLTRELVHKLQRDFGALYDYMVDRTVTWSEQESRASRKWEMVTKKPLPEPLSVDNPNLPLTDMFVGFDNRHGYLHIPHPYPLLPIASKSSSAAPNPVKKSLFGALKKSKVAPARDAKEQLQVALAFNEATNLDKLGVGFEASDIIDQFERYERDMELKGVSPREARLGRWILLYGVLQILSTLSVDTRGLKFKEGVEYFLCPSLKKCPPWDPNGRLPMAEAVQHDSYCWLAPERWEQTYLRGGAITVGGGNNAPAIPSLTELGDDSTTVVVSELDGHSITQRRLDRQFGSMFLEDKGIKYRVDRSTGPDQSALLRDVRHLSEKKMADRRGGYFEEDGIHFV